MNVKRERPKYMVFLKSRFIKIKINIFCRCKRKYTEKFNEDVKSKIISKLYAGQAKNEQDIFLLGLIEVKPCERRRKRTGNDTHLKNNTFSFFVINENRERKLVCKKPS